MRPSFLLPAFLILLTCYGRALAQPYYFSRYQVENGLSNNTVMCSLQDKNGFLWFGTKDGLNRFDGYTFKIFRTDPEDTTAIGSNFVRNLAEGTAGKIWVGTDRGLYEYDSETETFRFLKNSSTEEVRDIEIDQKGNVWFISGSTLVRYSEKTKKIKRYRNSEFFEASSISNIIDNEVWISTRRGTIEHYQAHSDTFVSYDMFENSPYTSSKWIERIFNTGRGSLLVGTSNQGVKIFTLKSGNYRDLLTFNSDKTEIFARDFLHESGDRYWFATESGIFIYDLHTDKYFHISKQYNDPYSISDNAAYTLSKDKDGGIWIGTYFGGLNYYPKQYTLFEKFFPKVGENSLSGNAVREVIQDKYANLWIGTEDGGLNKFDLRTGKFTCFKPTGKPTSISTTNIHGLLATGDTLWVGTFEHGLNLVDIKTGRVMKHYSTSPEVNGLKSNFIHSIFQARSGEIYFCTTQGLHRYDRRNKNFPLVKEVPEYIFYSTMFEDRDGTFWLGTYRDGVFYYNPNTGKKGYFLNSKYDKNSLSNNRVNSIYQDRLGYLWFATEGGLCKLKPGSKKFERYATKEGFPSDIIFSILEDEGGLLWISTSRGLVHFDPKTEKLKVYTKADGLLSDQLNYNSAYKDAFGRMYFGSVNGLVRFNPSEFTLNKFVPPVYITGFQVYSKELDSHTPGSPLKKSITFTEHIRLKHNQSSFSIDFAALSYTSPNRIEYAYKMEGLDKDWTHLKTNRKVYFTELPPGKYTFKVKASTGTGVWNSGETPLIIEILPPIWAGTPAYFVYALLIFGAGYFGIRAYHLRIKSKNRRRLEILEHRKEKEIYRAKIEFFTNVAHEIRTPLTLIKGPMEKIIKKAEEVPQIKSNLKIMEKNTERLLALTSQLLDFRKTESKGFSLNFVRTDITALLKDNYIRFKPAAEQKSIRFKTELPAEKLFAYIDIEALNKILSNLLSNALKYAESKVSVQLVPVNEGDTCFTIRIKNDGYPIPMSMREKIFETFFRLDETKQQSGTGLGLSLSRSLAELHKGVLKLDLPENNCNVFTLTLPIHQEIEFNPVMNI